MPLSDALGQGTAGWKKRWLPDLARPGWDPGTVGGVGPAPALGAPSPFQADLAAFGLQAGPSDLGARPLPFGAQFPVPPGRPMGDAALLGAGPTVAPPPGAASPAAGVDPGFLALLARLLQGLGGGARRTGRGFMDETGGGR